MNRPRTPEHFPRMKDRAAARHGRKTAREISKALDVVVDVYKAIGEVAARIVNGWAKLFEDVFGTVAATTRADFALAPPPVGLQAMIDDAEGRELVADILRRKNAA